MNWRAWVLGVGVATALVACQRLKPGEASLHFEGARTGHFNGGGVTCPAVLSISATWQWEGDVEGRHLKIRAFAANSTGIPDAFLISSEDISWLGRSAFPGETPADGQFTARVDERDKTLLHIEGTATGDDFGHLKVSGSMRCPCADPPCSY
ncbi:MAG TPA: hypothetical protein VI072_01590 [Polyangiaceae bacterium]